MKRKKIVLVGKSCSGKTELSLVLKEKGYVPALSCTSRPIRHNEEDGIHYDFVSVNMFEEMISHDEFIEYDNFNSWYYGLTKTRYAECDLLILTPRGLHHLLKKVNRDELIVIFMNTPGDERMRRSISRGDDPIEVERRYEADNIDFAEFIKKEEWDIAIDYRISDKFMALIDLFS